MRPNLRVEVPSRKLTLREWGQLDEDMEGELVEGVLEEEEVASYIHETVVAWFLVALSLWAKRRGGKVYGSEAKLAVGPRQGRKPDVSVYAKGALPSGRDNVARVAPYIVIEVLTPTPRDERRDRVEKVRDYARSGARYYWLADPSFRTLEILERNRRGRYELVLSRSGGRGEGIPGCPGLKLDLDELWREVEEAERR